MMRYNYTTEVTREAGTFDQKAKAEEDSYRRSDSMYKP
jgi:hypothetical protein